MRSKRILLVIVFALAVSSLGCRLATEAFAPPTPTATDTPVPPTSTITSTSAPTDTPTTEPTSTLPTGFTENGVRLCYYVPGVSVPAQMPPEVLATPTPFIYPTPELPFATQVDAETTSNQMETFNELWKAVNNNYVYPDFNGNDWDAIGEKYKLLIKKGVSQADFYFAMQEMIYELGDEHSSFETPEMVQEEQAAYAGDNNFVGIGAMSCLSRSSLLTQMAPPLPFLSSRCHPSAKLHQIQPWDQMSPEVVNVLAATPPLTVRV